MPASAFRKRPGRSAQVAGRDFEKHFAGLIGEEPIKNSGALWYVKMDVGSTTILFSLKYTEKETLQITQAMWRELANAITGLGGIGGDVVGAIATCVRGKVSITFQGEDWLRLSQSNEMQFVIPSKGEQKRQRASVPTLLRDAEDTKRDDR